MVELTVACYVRLHVLESLLTFTPLLYVDSQYEERRVGKYFFYILNRWIDIHCSNLESKKEIEYMFKFKINSKIILIQD